MINWDKPLCYRCLQKRESVVATHVADFGSTGKLYLCDEHAISYNRKVTTRVYAHTIHTPTRSS